jgi:hypothetical protein
MPAPAGTDAGTASQLIRGVGRTWSWGEPSERGRRQDELDRRLVLP